MNLDMLIKLAKLANHNPNEHEANSAARRVCQMLSEDNYKSLESALKIQSNSTSRQSGPVTWNDVKRSTEPWNWKRTTTEYEEYKKQTKNREDSKDKYQSKEYQYSYDDWYSYGFGTKVNWEDIYERIKRE